MFEYFGACFYINLEKNVTRRHEVEQEFKKYDIKADRRPGIIINGASRREDRETGSRYAHLACVEEAKLNKSPNVMIFEDDIIIDERFINLEDKIIDFLKNNDWGLFYFGANFMEPPARINNNVVRITRAFSIHAYAVNERTYDKLLSYKDIENPVDLTIADYIQKEGKCFAVTPRMVYQRDGYSDILNGESKYPFLREEL